MKTNEIMQTIKQLSKAQGYYGRLYNQLLNMNREEFKKVMTILEAQKFKDSVDLVIYLEGGY